LILWAGLDCGPGIEAFRQQVDEGLERFGYLPDDRAFVPHVTLARRARLNTPLAALAPLPLVEQACPARAFVLFNSRLGPGGSQYHALAALKPA
ncbi:MAG TPA: 2'-5' RNA ligase family protein, partial [Clostridia bacterium]|nr:2'-5' RNA ligase family protein [Clostridia bacterium]